MIVVDPNKVWRTLFEEVEVSVLDRGSEPLSLQIVQGDLRVSCPAIDIQPPVVGKLLGILEGEYVFGVT